MALADKEYNRQRLWIKNVIRELGSEHAPIRDSQPASPAKAMEVVVKVHCALLVLLDWLWQDNTLQHASQIIGSKVSYFAAAADRHMQSWHCSTDACIWLARQLPCLILLGGG